ncbi:MAG: DUF1592 domain-containing protein [Deltaproteobacteria bacterium]|nr:DUF1592 domain-containing protein [Nannocystaceae bacterium]
MRRHRLRAGTLGFWAVVSGAACGGADAGVQPAGSEDGTSAGELDESGSDTAPDACAPSPGRVGLQRLTRAEYNRTVRDLFGVTSAPADAFPPDSATSGFDNNASSLTVSPQLASLLLGAAEQVAAEAIANQGDTIIACDPDEDAGCGADTLAALALRVHRRPASDTELADLLALVGDAQAEGEEFAAAIEHALVGMLMSPQFLYRSIPPAADAPGEGGTIVALDDYALATRLSYFLWGSTPDDELLARAGAGGLAEPDALREQFDRMLIDPKSDALYDSFVRQWLQLGKLAAASPDPAAFPEWDEQLRAQMLAETRMFFEDLRARDGSVLEIVNGTQSFADASLASIYEVEGPIGEELVPVSLDATRRAGVLTMPAVLTMTSGAEQPNIVKRGVWLAESILCAAPPPPPPGVPPAPAAEPGESEREQLARHRLDPSCASCHDLIDPLGFGFEHYGALGHWRDEADGAPVDDLGSLPDGRTYHGMVELAGLLATSDDYPNCVSSKLMTYALGRTLDGAEACVIEALGADNVTADATLSDLLWAVVNTEAFRSEEIVGDP